MIFDRFTESPDFFGHELTHGVTENEARPPLRVEGRLR
jgi:Zn-dependent metalloprotease